MKNMKKQLFTAVAMLLVATVALGTATYAWFVNNAAVEVGQMDFTASTSTALEIGVEPAASTTDDTDVPYSSLVTTANITGMTGYTSFGALSLIPASADDNAILAGNFFYDKAWAAGNGSVSEYQVVATGDIGAGMVKMVPLWFRASQDMKVYLASGAAVTASVGGNQAGAYSDQINKALRVSFVSGDTAADVKTYQFDKDGTVTGAAFNYAAGVTTAEQGVASVSNGVATFATQTAADGFNPVNNTTNMWIAGEQGTATELFALSGGTGTSVKVYVWLEGCDKECVAAVAGGNVQVKLNFIGEPIVTP